MARKDPLENWTTLNRLINRLSESHIRELIARELKENKRKTFVIRLHVRLCTLRTSRERRELIVELEK